MKIQICLLFCLLSYVSFSQNNESIQENVKDRFRTGDLKVSNSSSGTFYGFDNSTSEVVGTAYYDADWHKYNVKFYPKTINTPIGTTKLDSINDIPCRINLKDNVIEFRVDFQTKIIDVDLVKTIKDGTKTLLVNVKEFESDTYQTGLVEEIVAGNYGLYLHYKVIVKKPDYSPALNTGSKDIRVIKEGKMVFKIGKKLYPLSGKKALAQILGDKFKIADDFMSKNDLSYKEVKDLTSLVNFLNDSENR